MSYLYKTKFIFFLFFFLFEFPFVNAQDECGTDSYFEYYKSQNPYFQDTLDYYYNQYYINKSARDILSDEIIYIPVVVHIIHNGGSAATNISDVQVHSQIQFLNDCYANIRSSIGLGVNTNIRFCLANQDPIGNSSSGITRDFCTQANFTPYDALDNPTADNSLIKSFSPWPRGKYLNIWVCDLLFHTGTNSLKGYATFPWDSSPLDGVVIDYERFGNLGTIIPGNMGTTTVHEVGHWLGLWHVFQVQSGGGLCDNSDCLLNGDQVCDTDPVNKSAVPWAPLVTAANCSNRENCDGIVIPAENYMEYNFETCRTFFTEGQKDRMRYMLSLYRSYMYSTSISNPSVLPTECSSPGTTTGGGVGGGGSGECKTIQFQVNGKSTFSGDFVNVCKDNILINPHDYGTCSGTSIWDYTGVHTHTNHIPCGLAGTPSGSPVNCYTDLVPILFWGSGDCICQYRKLFLAVQEIDESKNVVGAEYSYWFDQPIGFSGFVLNSYLPSGSSIQEGKFYKIKIATASGGTWKEYTSFIKIYADNLLIQNKTIIHDQFANILTIENSSVPFSADIKVVAKTKIEILPLTTLESGVYYIDNFDCNGLDQFRSVVNTPPYESAVASAIERSTSTYLPIDKKEEQHFSIDKKSILKIYPNPAIDELNIEFELSFDQIVSLDLYTINSHFIKSIVASQFFHSGVNNVATNFADIPNGVYFVKFSTDNLIESRKIVVLRN